MPSTVKIPNCFFRTFKKVPIEYSKRKNEKNTMTISEIVINMFRAAFTPVICSLDEINKPQTRKDCDRERTAYKIGEISSGVSV